MHKEEFYSIVGKDVLSSVTNGTSTPCYIYFKRILHKRFSELRHCLPPSFRIHYAIKANPNPTLLRELSSLGVGADVASLGELVGAMASGISASSIEFSGPGKSDQEISQAILRGISSINAESLSELEAIVRISRQLRKSANVGLRINPRGSSHDAGMTMSGDTQFGLSPELAAEALDLLKDHEETVTFTGVHVHAGSQILSTEALIRHFQMILDLSLEVTDLGILPVRKINFGGGWGITYFPNQNGLDLQELGDGIKGVFAATKYAKLMDVTHIVEPGRFLTGECGVYLTQVLHRQPRDRKQFLIVDGGMHHNYLLAGGMGQVIRRNFEIDVIWANPNAQPQNEVYDIAGCLCTPQDILATKFGSNRAIDAGDRIIFFNCGAYGLTASPINFLSHDPPAEIFV